MKLEFHFKTTDEIDAVLVAVVCAPIVNPSEEVKLCLNELASKLAMLRGLAEAEAEARRDDGIPY
jgi:hypothetical protein